jgi:hypothetical protein
MSIANFISGAITLHNLGQHDTALALVCSSIDGTSKKVFPNAKKNTDRNKDFIKKYFRLISTYGFPGISAESIRIKCINIQDVTTDKEGYVGIEEIIYHIIRCSLIHECELDSRIQFIDQTQIGDFNKFFQLPKQTIFGLILAVVLCKNNWNEKCNQEIAINLNGQLIDINDIWGQEDKWLPHDACPN